MDQTHWGGIPYSKERATKAVLTINNKENFLKPIKSNWEETVIVGTAYAVIGIVVIVLLLN